MKKPVDPASVSEKTLQSKVKRIVSRFESEKGALHFTKRSYPLSGLINTILSQNTNDNNRDKAYTELRTKYRTWKEVHEAPVDDVAQAIRTAGLNKQKASRIQALLEYLKNTRGDYKADFLKEMDFDQALAEIGHLKGIGPKTLSVVLAFNLGVDVFPVDTHVHRLCKRLGFVPDNFDAVKTFNAMRNRVPAGKSYQFHLHLIFFGRKTCHARKPKCHECFIQDECYYYHNLKEEK